MKKVLALCLLCLAGCVSSYKRIDVKQNTCEQPVIVVPNR